MKVFWTVWLFCLMGLGVGAQGKYDANWCFGYRAGIDLIYRSRPLLSRQSAIIQKHALQYRTNTVICFSTFYLAAGPNYVKVSAGDKLMTGKLVKR